MDFVGVSGSDLDQPALKGNRNHVERFVIDAGHTAERLGNDYGYDLNAITYDSQRDVEPGSINIQLKVAENLAAVGTNYDFKLDIRDYSL